MTALPGRPPGLGYRPQRGSVAARVSFWFAQNRDEQLTRRDVCDKFDAQPASIDGCLAKMVEVGWIKRGKLEDTTTVYEAGLKLPAAIELEALAKDVPAEMAASRRGRVDPVDLSTVQIEKGIPIPSKPGTVRTTSTAILMQMEVGDSILLPLRQAKAVRDVAFSHVSKQHPERRYSLRQVDDKNSRIWRIA